MMLAQKVITVLERKPTEEEEEEIINGVLEQVDSSLMLVDWAFPDDLSADLNVGFLDQMQAYKRDAGPEAVYLVLLLIGDVVE